MWVIRGIAAAGLVAGFASGAHAQSAQSAEEIQRNSTGVRLGGFILRPEVNVTSEYNDNYLELEDGSEGAFILRAAPKVTLESDWRRHRIGVEVGGEIGEYFEDVDGSDDYIDYNANVSGTLDVTRRLAVRSEIGFHHEHQERGSDDVGPTVSDPVEFDRITAEIEGRYKPGLLRFSPFVGYETRDYDDVSALGGGTSDQDFRDRDKIYYGAEVGYEFLRGYEAFVRGELDHVNYDVNDPTTDRTSDGIEIEGGVNLSVTRLITARLGAGYETREYDNFEDFSGFSLDARGIWSVTPLTTITASAARDVAETTVDGASGAVKLRGQLEVDHAVRRDVLLNAFISAQNEEFEGISRTDDTIAAGLGAEWVINPNFAANVGYKYTNEDSTVDGESFDASQVFIGFSAKY